MKVDPTSRTVGLSKKRKVFTGRGFPQIPNCRLTKGGLFASVTDYCVKDAGKISIPLTPCLKLPEQVSVPTLT